MPDSVSTLEENGTDGAKIAEIADTTAPVTERELLEDSLVEEVSIDGMCGVY